MNLKALRRPHDPGRTTTSRFTNGMGAQRGARRAHPFPGAARLVARWTLASDGRPELVWTLEPERPAHHLINRKRGSHD